MEGSKNKSFWFFTIGIMILLICPVLIQDGMFMDGQQYAIVAKNLAEGRGSFWFPYLSDTWMKAGSTSFMEHPPLVYGLQSLFFSLFGKSMYIERFYSLLMAILTSYTIVLSWKLVFRSDESLKNKAWFPVLIWVIIPVNFWAYQNNMQENTMGLFTLLSVYFSLHAVLINKKVYFYLLLSGVALFLATLSKGPPGFFPLVTLFVYWLVSRKISFFKMLIYSIFVGFIPAIIYTLFLLIPEANESLTFYFNERLLHRINHEGVVENRWYSIGKVFLELIPSMVISAALILFSRSKNKLVKLHSKRKEAVLFFFLIGVSASFPLVLTPVQRGFYLVPAMPFFALALAMLSASSLQEILEKIGSKTQKFLSYASVLLLVISVGISIMQIGKASRDQDMLHDVYLMGTELPEGENVKIEEYLYDNWSLQFYFLRHFNVSLGPNVEQSAYYLVEKGQKAKAEYQIIPLDTKAFDLYKKE